MKTKTPNADRPSLSLFAATQAHRLLLAVLFLLALRVTVLADITNNLVLYLPFDEGSGTNAADASGQDHGAALFNFPTDNSQWVPGISGNALDFEEFLGSGVTVQPYVLTTNGIALTNGNTLFSFAFWAKAKLPNPPYTQARGFPGGPEDFNPRIIEPKYSSANHWILWQSYPYTSAPKGIGIYSVTPVTTNPSTNWWHHFVVTFTRSSSFKVYVDGVYAGANTGAPGAKADPSGLPWLIGHQENLTSPPNTGDNWHGYLDEVRIYNRLLSAADVQELYYATPHLPIEIATQPQGATVNLGDWYTLSVTPARNEPSLAYQWYEGAATVPNATNSSLALKPVQLSSAGNYSVVITNTLFSNSSVTSSVATVTVSDPPADVTSGLIAYYPFDETTGTAAADASGNGYSATLQNFTHTDTDSWWVSGVPGLTNTAGRSGALQFNSLDTVTNEYVLTDGALAFTNPEALYTITFWARRTSDNNPANPRFAGPATSPANNQHWVLWGTAYHGVGFYTPAASTEPMKFAWQHFAVTYNRTNGGNGQYSTFVNGVKQTVASPSQAKLDPNGHQWVFGHNEDTSLNHDTDPWRGYLDDMRIYNRILTPTDIKALYSMATIMPPTNTVPPQSVDLYAGDTLRLRPSWDGTTPFLYQWYKNGSAISGATNLNYAVQGVQTTDAGSYTQVVQGQTPTAVTSVVASVTVTAITSVTNGLAGYWKFDDASGSTAADSSGRGNNGTINNGPVDGGQWTSGQVGGALQFRGSGLGDDYVIIPGWPKAVNGTMTFSAWVLADANVSGAYVAGGGSGADGTGQFGVNTPSTLDLRGAVENSSHVAASARETVGLPTHAWQHVMIVANATNLLVYRNGSQVGSVAYDGTLYNPTNALSIGGLLVSDDGSVQYGSSWQGKIDDAAYWTRALSAAEVFELFAAGYHGYPVTQADAYSNSPPIITADPQSTSIYLHEPFSPALKVAATSPRPLSYQWWKDGVPIFNATNTTYSKAGAVEFVDGGSYSAVVSDSGGSVTSAPALVTISAPTPEIGNGLVEYLKLNETSGTTAADSSANANNGTLINFSNPDANWLPGVIDGALQFDGPAANTAVVVPDQPFLDMGSSSFSLSLWAKGNPQLDGSSLFCKGASGTGESYCLDTRSANRGYRFYYFDPTPTHATTVRELITQIVPSGQWQHVAVIYNMDSGQARICIDGTFITSAMTYSSLYDSTSIPLNVGSRPDGGGGAVNPWTGVIDDVRVYGRAITPLEVRALNYQGHPPALAITPAAGLATLSWPFEATTVFELQAAPALDSTWTNVPTSTTTNSVTVAPSAETLFYRLHRK